MASRSVRRILDRALESGRGGSVSISQGTELLSARNPADVAAITAAANTLRAAAPCGEHVTYVVNRNINFTNACTKRCGFCAFSRTGIDDESYYLPTTEVLRRVREAVYDHGATEVCVQAGLPLRDEHGARFVGTAYLDLIRAVKAEAPHVHVHALSPEEVIHGADTLGITVKDFLVEAAAAGVGSLPGTSAEILDDTLRERMAKGRLSTEQWVEVVREAHGLGIPTTRYVCEPTMVV